MRPIDKLYFRIGEVSKLLGVEPSVIRYWETEFPGLRPQRSKTGQRVYSRGDLRRLEEIKHLRYDRGYTTAGALKVLRNKGLEVREPDDPIAEHNHQLEQSLRELRSRIVEFLEELEREEGTS